MRLKSGNRKIVKISVLLNIYHMAYNIWCKHAYMILPHPTSETCYIFICPRELFDHHSKLLNWNLFNLILRPMASVLIQLMPLLSGTLYLKISDLYTVCQLLSQCSKLIYLS